MEPATQPGAELSDRDRLRAAISNQVAKPAQAEPKQEAQPEPAEQEEPQQDVTATTGAETEAEAEETTAADRDVQDESQSLDLSDISQLFGIDDDKLTVTDDGVFIKTKVDGQEGLAKLSDLVKSYQLEGHLNKKNMEVQEARKALDAERQKVEETARAKFQALEDATKLAFNQLTAEFNAVNWQDLETRDPAKYTLLRQKFADRHQQIQQGVMQLEAERQQRAMANQAQLAQRKEQEIKMLATRIPEWSTPEGMVKGQAELREGLKNSYGYQDEEIIAALIHGQPVSTVDHRFFLVLKDALEYRKLQSKKPDVINMVRKAPKVVKGGSKPEQKKPNATQDILSRIRSTGGKKGDIAAFLKSKRK